MELGKPSEEGMNFDEKAQAFLVLDGCVGREIHLNVFWPKANLADMLARSSSSHAIAIHVSDVNDFLSAPTLSI